MKLTNTRPYAMLVQAFKPDPVTGAPVTGARPIYEVIVESGKSVTVDALKDCEVSMLVTTYRPKKPIRPNDNVIPLRDKQDLPERRGKKPLPRRK